MLKLAGFGCLKRNLAETNKVLLYSIRLGNFLNRRFLKLANKIGKFHTFSIFPQAILLPELPAG